MRIRSIVELKGSPQESKEISKLAMDIMQFIFSKSQENLVTPMEWGDETRSGNGRKPTVITDQSILLLSGIPPYWENDKTLVFRYDAPHAKWVEFGTPPHAMAASRLVGWVNRKLQKKGAEGIEVAYKVANKIRTKGIEPHPYLRPAIEEAVTRFKLNRRSG